MNDEVEGVMPSPRSPFDAKPLSAEEYRELLATRPELVLRVSDGTGNGTYRFWVDDDTLWWRCLNWGAPQPCPPVHLSACLDDVPGDASTQLLVERSGDADA
jgi:hypothetical protein